MLLGTALVAVTALVSIRWVTPGLGIGAAAERRIGPRSSAL